jgi:hypothetical protein
MKARKRSSTVSELDTSDIIDNQPVYPVFKENNCIMDDSSV